MCDFGDNFRWLIKLRGPAGPLFASDYSMANSFSSGNCADDELASKFIDRIRSSMLPGADIASASESVIVRTAGL